MYLSLTHNPQTFVLWEAAKSFAANMVISVAGSSNSHYKKVLIFFFKKTKMYIRLNNESLLIYP